MNNYRLGKYKFNRRMTQVIGALVIIAAIVIGGGFKQATYVIDNPVPSIITLTGDADTASDVIADELLSIHATVDDRLHEKYLQGVFTPIARLISSAGTIAASTNLVPDDWNAEISGSLNVINVPEGTYTFQIVFDSTNTGELSDEITGITIAHPAPPAVIATLTISGSNPRTGTVDIWVTGDTYPTYWTDRLIVKNSAGTEIISAWKDLSVAGSNILYFDTTAYANGDYTIIGEIYEYDASGDQWQIASDTKIITIGNEAPPTNNLVANIYVKTESGEYSSWPVVKDGTGVLFGTVLIEGIVTGDTPTSVYFVIELNGQELNRFVMSMTASGNYAVEFDTTTLADGNYDMLVEANFADGTSIKMSAWGFGVVPGGGDAGISNFVMIGLVGLVVVIFVYGLKKREMLYT